VKTDKTTQKQCAHLHGLEDVVLGDKAQVLGSLGEGLLLVVRAAHPAAHHHVEAWIEAK
jgi:hypothetical protein